MEIHLVRALVCLAILFSAAVHAAEASGAGRTRTVLLLGDSLLVTSFGESLEQSLNALPGTHCVRRARSSTGLARPDFYDWMAAGREAVERHHPDAVVIILGGNDGQDLTDTKGKGRVHWGSAEWETAYRQRVLDFLDVLAAPGRKLLWIELPVTGLKSFERKLVLIRRVLREAVVSREDATHLDTKPFFTDPKGELLLEASVEGFRKPMRLRMDDGVHFTLAGGRYFASKVYPAVLELLGPASTPDAVATPLAEESPHRPEAAVCTETDAASEVPFTPMAYCGG